MSITDELRKWMYGHTVNCSDNRIALVAIADRIDAEHDELLKNAYEDIASDEFLEGHGWVKLPVDADGVPIRVGDMLDGYGKTIEVVEIRHGRSGWVLISRDGNGYADTFAFTHHYEPTVEDVLEGFARAYDDIGGRPDEDELWGKLLAEYAAKLRLAGEGE